METDEVFTFGGQRSEPWPLDFPCLSGSLGFVLLEGWGGELGG